MNPLTQCLSIECFGRIVDYCRSELRKLWACGDVAVRWRISNTATRMTITTPRDLCVLDKLKCLADITVFDPPSYMYDMFTKIDNMYITNTNPMEVLV